MIREDGIGNLPGMLKGLESLTKNFIFSHTIRLPKLIKITNFSVGWNFGNIKNHMMTGGPDWSLMTS